MRTRSALAVLGVVLGAASARAGEPSKPSSLSWVRLEGAESCITTQALARAVEARLGHAVFVSPSEAELSVEGSVGPIVGSVKWRATVALRGRDGQMMGTRTIESGEAECGALDDKLALAIAIMIDPEGALTKHDPPPPPPPPPPVEHAVTVYVPVPAPAPAPAPEAWHVEPQAGVGLYLGFTPQIGFGVFGAANVASPIAHIGFRLAGHFIVPNGIAVDTGRAEMWAALGSAAYCPLFGEAGRMSSYLCVGGFAGLFHASGEGLPSTRSGSLPLLGAVLDWSASVRLVGPLTAGATASLGVAIVRGHVAYTDASGRDTEVYATGLLSFSSGVFLGLRFP
ncbi:MAG TPA: hypothetical protein VF316_21665 [Polyangiaceae bacterium]